MDPKLEQFLQAISRPENEWDLFELALKLGRISEHKVNSGACRRLRNEMAVKAGKKAGSTDLDKLNAFNQVFFDDYGFRGNTENYYDPQNSFLHTVLESRRGIPISLCIIYQSMASRCGLELQCVGMPGHFLLRHERSPQTLFVDVFNQGQFLLPDDCRNLFERLFPHRPSFNPTFLRPTSNRQVCLRMLMNLKQIYRSRGESKMLLQVLERRIPLLEDPLPEILERGLTYLDLQDFSSAVRDLEIFVDETEDAQMRELVRTQLGRVRSLLH